MKPRRCKACGVARAGWSLGPEGDALHTGCARHEEVREGGMCASMRIELLQAALRRALVPEAFHENGRIKSGWILECLAAQDAALRHVAALRGPFLISEEGGR